MQDHGNVLHLFATKINPCERTRFLPGLNAGVPGAQK